MPPFDPNDPVQTALATAQQVRDTPTMAPPDTNPMQRELTNNGLFSHAADVLRDSKQNKGTWQQYRAALLKGGVKPDEMKWSGADEKFQPNQMLTREQLKRHFDTALPKLHETQYADNSDDCGRYGATGRTQYHDYTLPGGKNYRELLLHTSPTMPNIPKPDRVTELPEGYRVIRYRDDPRGEWGVIPPGQVHAGALGGRQFSSEKNAVKGALEYVNYHNDAAHRDKVREYEEGLNYRSSHWQGVPNVVAHLRMSDRPLPNKRKALHLEELQSDWAQEGRSKGFKSDEPDVPKLLGKIEPQEGGMWKIVWPDGRFSGGYGSQEAATAAATTRGSVQVPRAPYVDSTAKWVDLGLKRALHEAAKGGYDKLLITPGEEHAKRYDLARQMRRIEYDPESGHLSALPHGEGNAIQRPGVTPEQLPSHIGHELAKKLLASPVVASPAGFKLHRLEGPDMRVGGEGMKSFYDRIVPQALEKLAKKHDPEARVQLHGHELPKSETKLHSLEITPKMRESILRGQSAFADGGAVAGNSVTGAVSSAADASDKGQLDKRANDLIGQIAANSKTADGGAYAKGGKVRQPEPDIEGMINDAPLDELEHPARIPTRLVTSKKLASHRHHDVGVEALRATPDLYKRNVDLIRSYPNMPASVARKSHDAVTEHFINHVKDNLLDLHDRVAPEIRGRSKLWYDGARNIVNKWMKDYNLPDHSIAGALAALSPQKDWYQNVSLAKRVLDTMRGGGDKFYKGFNFSPEMEKTFRSRESLNKPVYQPLLNSVRGKTLHDIDQMHDSPEERAIAKALWIRMYDETYNDPSHPIVTPEGNFGEPVMTAPNRKGVASKARVGWGSLGEIAKAIRSIEAAHDPSQLSQLMGERHKVRNFYNNILTPNSKRGDVTIDTHAVAAGLMRPLSGNSLEVVHNFANHPGKGLRGAGTSALTGIGGLYPHYAEAYRRAAKERGILPREMQSITWEAIRGLFPDTFKTAKNNARINAVWRQYRNGEIDQKTARSMIYDIAGQRHAIAPPTWWQGGADARPGTASADAAPQNPADARELPELAVRGPDTRPTASRGRGRTAGDVQAPLSSRVKPVKSAPTSPSVDEALRIAAEATR